MVDVSSIEQILGAIIVHTEVVIHKFRDVIALALEILTSSNTTTRLAAELILGAFDGEGVVPLLPFLTEKHSALVVDVEKHFFVGGALMRLVHFRKSKFG